MSDANAGGGAAAMTEDETPRFSNARHRSRGDDDGDNDARLDGARLEDDSPADVVSSAILR